MHLDIIVTLAVAVFGSTGFWTWIQSRNRKRSAEDRLLLGLAYDKIIWNCNKCRDRNNIIEKKHFCFIKI